MPCDGRIVTTHYRPGLFVNAALDKASEDNERNGLVIDTPRGTFGVVQIAGLIARRIVCRAKEGDVFARGERFGIIKFGSRTDLFLPLEAEVKVRVGDKVAGAASVVAVLP